jgi:DNA-binding CsgD family transcriptional regulator
MESLPENRDIFTEKEWEVILEELSLSPRQKEVVRNLFYSLSDKQIAAKLNISVPTVRTHIGRLFSRFHLQDRSELILRIFQQFRQGCRMSKDECQRWHHEIDTLPESPSGRMRQQASCMSLCRRRGKN